MFNQTVNLKWYNINEQLPSQVEIHDDESDIIAMSNRLLLIIDDKFYFGTYTSEQYYNINHESYIESFIETFPFEAEDIYYDNDSITIFSEYFNEHKIFWAEADIVKDPKILQIKIK